MPLASTGVHSRPPPPRSSSGFRAARSFVYFGNPRCLRVPHLLNGDNLVGVLVSGLVNRGELGTEARMSQSVLSACWHSPVPGGLRPTPPEDKPKGGRPPGPTKGRAGVGGHGEPRQGVGAMGNPARMRGAGVGDTPGNLARVWGTHREPSQDAGCAGVGDPAWTPTPTRQPHLALPEKIQLLIALRSRLDVHSHLGSTGPTPARRDRMPEPGGI